MRDMQNAAVLNIGTGANRHIVNISPDGDEGPDADIIGHSDIAEHHAAGIDHHAIAFLGEQIFIRT
ncbi:hypothetical protein R1N_42330 [Enterobacter asburiae]|nr:hypothetical protein EAA2563_40860 [Enterobacter asburiae]BCP72046.1 hypothetical protein R1N_42330 [Enterobacter asburiae]